MGTETCCRQDQDQEMVFTCLYPSTVQTRLSRDKRLTKPVNRLRTGRHYMGHLYTPSHRQVSRYHGLCYTSCGALAGMRNRSMGHTSETAQTKLVCVILMITKSQRKEGNVLFNDTLNTFYFWLYGIKHMVKDHMDSERGNLLLPHGLLFLISSKGSFICIIPDRITHITAFVTPVTEHWLE